MTPVQHSYMKRYLADRYANTNMMKPEVLSGIVQHARDFLAKCLEQCYGKDGFADIYVSKPPNQWDCWDRQTDLSTNRYLCIAMLSTG